MSFYYKHNYVFSDHGLQRCRERLNLKSAPDYEVKEAVIKHIQNSTRSFEAGNEIYISASNTQIYFIIDRRSNLIITATKISAEKQLSIMSRGI
ncbi:hypothetical protein [Mesoplasma seiffertii]|uniref:hypothetical protein n=1 Tax=Mesoplasma seiffertii TaxID=28224 RepID=UPI00047DAFA4|nr:hypothetical protein [Mesoplasma seiffertii]